MSESTFLPASTIHRFLKWNKETGEFMINEENKSKVDLVIVDEVSMIDINLFDSLLKGLKRGVKMILVGDYNQLPSVGPGNLLKDLILTSLALVIISAKFIAKKYSILLLKPMCKVPLRHSLRF